MLFFIKYQNNFNLSSKHILSVFKKSFLIICFGEKGQSFLSIVGEFGINHDPVLVFPESRIEQNAFKLYTLRLNIDEGTTGGI